MPDLVLFMGYTAAFCTTCSFVPQVLHIIRTKDTHSISLGMYTIFVTGVTLWLIYGVIVKDLPLVVANSVTLFLSGIILIIKFRDVLQAQQRRRDEG